MMQASACDASVAACLPAMLGPACSLASTET